MPLTIAMTPSLERGRKVSCDLYSGEEYVVVQVFPSAEPLRSFLDGFVVAGGGEVELVNDLLYRSRVPEAIIRGVQWRIHPETLPASEVNALEAATQAAEARRTQERQATAHRTVTHAD